MAKKIETEILINASTNKVWAILTDFDNYPNWNPFIKSIKGDIHPNKQIVVTIAPPNATKMTFRPTVLKLEKNKQLSWLGHVLFQGLFDGEHLFELVDNGDGTTLFKHNEEFRGLLAWMFNPEKTKKGFLQMNQKLKELAEH